MCVCVCFFRGNHVRREYLPLWSYSFWCTLRLCGAPKAAAGEEGGALGEGRGRGREGKDGRSPAAARREPRTPPRRPRETGAKVERKPSRHSPTQSLPGLSSTNAQTSDPWTPKGGKPDSAADPIRGRDIGKEPPPLAVFEMLEFLINRIKLENPYF